MNDIKLAATDFLALLALSTLGFGVWIVGGIGWAITVVSALVLLYLILPDNRGEPT